MPTLDALDTDRSFFAALLAADGDALDDLLHDDFVIIDVARGGETKKGMLLMALTMGMLRFEKVEPADTRVRTYGTTAIVTGRTSMTASFNGQSFTTVSRYTHVYVEHHGRYQMVNAQGTAVS